MEAINLSCMNCGTPLEVMDGGDSITCPSCYSVNLVKKDGGELQSEALASLDQKMESVTRGVESNTSSLDISNRINIVTSELHSLRDTFRNDFVPSMQRTGKQLDAQRIAFDRAFPPKSTGIVGLVVFAVIALFFIIGSAGDGGDPQALGVTIVISMIVGGILGLRIWMRKGYRKRREQKIESFKAEWAKWVARNEAFKKKMMELEGELQELKRMVKMG